MTSLTPSETALSCDPSCISTLPANTMASVPLKACMQQCQSDRCSTRLCVKLHCKPRHWRSAQMLKLVMQQEIQHVASSNEMAVFYASYLCRALHPRDATNTACTACKAHLQGHQAPGPGNGVAQRGCCGLGSRQAALPCLLAVLVIARLRPSIIAAFRPARQDGGCALPVCVQDIGVRGAG